jgi:kynurenine formamidase
MIGVQNVVVPYDQHVALLGKAGGPIPIIEELDHCADLRAERFLFLGLPMRVQHLEASWIRAVAFEPR